jgi:hypothetical protein
VSYLGSDTFLFYSTPCLLQNPIVYIAYCYVSSGEESTIKQPGYLPSKELFHVFRRWGKDVQRTRTGHGLGAIRGTQFSQEVFDVEFDGM